VITPINNDPTRVSGYSDTDFLALAEALAGNHEKTFGEFTAAVIRRLVGMVKR
jgi:hypothetical protein